MDRCFAVKARLVEQLDLPFLNWVHTMQRATRALVDGDPETGEQLAQQALQLGSDGGQPDVATVFGTQLIMVQLLRGTLGDAGPTHRTGGGREPGHGRLHRRAGVGPRRCRSIRRGTAHSRWFRRSGFRLPLDVAWLTAMIACAEAAAACGDPGYAQPLLDQLAPFSDQWLCTDVSASGPVSRTVGDLLTNLGRYDEAETAVRGGPFFERRGGRLVLPGPDGLLVGPDAGPARRSGRSRQGLRPAHEGPQRCQLAWVRHRRAPGGCRARTHRPLNAGRRAPGAGFSPGRVRPWCAASARHR